MADLLPFFFHWSLETDTTFSPEMETVDEDIFSFVLKHDEAQAPTLDITLLNPRIGLLNPGRKTWAWLSYQSANVSGVIPLFFGNLVGVPTDLFKELVTLKFIARDPQYIALQQAVAETLRVSPQYEPLFLDEKHRDDPDAVLEGWSARYHSDRIPTNGVLEVTASDILVGELGTIDFDQNSAFYDSLSLQLGEAPLTDVRVQATVNWTQRTLGYINGPDINVTSYTGESFMGDWPKPGSKVGGGWEVSDSFMFDVYKVKDTPNFSSSSNWTNGDPDAAEIDCNPATASYSSSGPALLSPGAITLEGTRSGQTGLCDPFGFATFADDAEPGVNIPMKLNVTGSIVPQWTLNGVWTFRYDAKRDFSETLIMDVKANVQGILNTPTVQQNSEEIVISGANVGEPLINVDAWTDFSSRPVEISQVIFPNNPTKPGGISYQVCVQAGVAGDTEPDFSDITGDITADGTVLWASLGRSPLTEQPDWTRASFVPVGETICYQEIAFDPRVGDMRTTGRATYYICTTAGQTNRLYTEITYIPAIVDNDEAVPAADHFFFFEPPPFVTTPGALVNENGNGTVQWTCLGTSPQFLGIPIGGTPTNVTARCFFPTDRGQLAVQHLIYKARARLRMRSRAVKITWDCPFEDAIFLSCRYNATINDPRLPGAAATGKITSYSLTCSGGKFRGHVEIGCSVGYGGSIGPITGTPEYTASTGYMEPGYQRYDGAFYTSAEEDIAYSPPRFAPFDDGLVFPLQELPATWWINGSIEAQQHAFAHAATTEQQLENAAADTGFQNRSTVPGAWWKQQVQQYYGSNLLSYIMEANPVSFEMRLDPVVNGPFNGSYAVDVTVLELPQGINLKAPSL